MRITVFSKYLSETYNNNSAHTMNISFLFAFLDKNTLTHAHMKKKISMYIYLQKSTNRDGKRERKLPVVLRLRMLSLEVVGEVRRRRVTDRTL